MLTLQVEDVPEDVFEQIRVLAAQKQLTVSQQAVRLLERALREEQEVTHAAALAELRRNRWAPPPGTPDSVELLRGDRQR